MWEKIYEPGPGFQEAYSTMEMWDYVLGPFKDYLNDKIICCPCDSNESKCVQWLMENTDAEILNFGEMDCNSEEARFIMKTSNIVITDPPFCKEVFVPFLEYLITNDIPFIILGPYGTDYTKEYPTIFELRTENPNYPFWPHTLINGKPHRVRGRIYTNIKE